MFLGNLSKKNLNDLVFWASEIGVKTVKDLIAFRNSACTSDSSNELLNRLNGYYVYDIKFKESK